MAKSSGYVII